MLARIKFIHSNSNRLNKKDLDKLEIFLGEKVETSQLKINEDGKVESVSWKETFDKEKAEKDKDYKLVIPTDMYQISDSNNYIVDLELFTSEFSNLEFSLKGVPKAVGGNHLELFDMMNKVAQKIEEAKNRFEKVVEFNQKCEVHVPNLGLMNINKLAYATDYCTEELQKLLFQGWRIVPSHKRKDTGHIAVMPEEIVENIIESLSGQVILDPFCGSGTTCVVARKYNRYFIGFELNPEYIEKANMRLDDTE